ncbi:unnamed protein product [Discula destructiva]
MASPTPLRRITRESLRRFAHVDADAKPTRTATPDIEDIIPAAPNTTTSVSRKRKRTLTAAPANTPHIKLEASALDNIITTSTTTTTPPRRARKPARKTHDPTTGAETVAAPSDWAELYAAAKAMRLPGGAAANAAVDTMGCERLADVRASPRDQRFHTLVALMLSSQTKDTTNFAAMTRLKTELPACAEGAPVGLNLENMLAVAPEKLNELIWAVGFHNNKTKYLKQTAEILRDQWGGDIPDSIEGLVSLPGVGPKMAHLCLSAAWGRTEGIGVDVHVHRITNMWGWHKTKNPEETRMALQSWLPREKWHEINWLLVGLGQTVCAPVGKKCGDCQLGLDGLCKAADRGKINQARKLRDMKVEVKMGEDEDIVKVEEEEETTVRTVGGLSASDIKEDSPAASARPTRRRGKAS